jgi:hypothetical protein
MTFGQQGFHVLLITSMIMFLGARAGRVGAGWLTLRKVSPSGRRWLSIIMVLTFSALATLCRYRLVACPRYFSHQSLNPGTCAHLNGGTDLMRRQSTRDGAVRRYRHTGVCHRVTTPDPIPVCDRNDGFRTNVSASMTAIATPPNRDIGYADHD